MRVRNLCDVIPECERMVLVSGRGCIEVADDRKGGDVGDSTEYKTRQVIPGVGFRKQQRKRDLICAPRGFFVGNIAEISGTRSKNELVGKRLVE